MSKTVNITNRREVFRQAFFRVEEVTLQHEQYNGELSDTLTRVTLHRGDSVAAVLHCVDTDELILVEQFRVATYDAGPGWIRELPAGTVSEGEEPDAAMKRELLEETGYDIEELEPISTVYLSPGGSSERVHLYYALVYAGDQVTDGGGVDSENEDIRIDYLPLEQVQRMLAGGDIMDAKTMIGVQWLLARMQK